MSNIGRFQTSQYLQETWISRNFRKSLLYAMKVENCLTACVGEFSGRSGPPTIILEAVT